MQPSPFTPGIPTTEVHGREQQLREITELLIQPALHGRSARQILCETGPAGSGRSSLLLRAREDAERLGMRVISLDAATGLDLEGAVRQAQGESAAGLLLLLDDVDRAPAPQLAQLPARWEAARALGTPVVLLCAASAEGAAALGAGTVSAPVRQSALEPLFGAELRRAFTAPADRARVSWQGEVLTEVMRRSGGVPALIQAWGDAVWQAAGAPDPGQTIAGDVVEQAAELMAAG